MNPGPPRRKSCRVRSPLGDGVVILPADKQEGESSESPRASEIMRWVRDTMAASGLIRMLEATGVRAQGAAANDRAWLAAQLEEAFLRGRLLLIRDERTVMRHFGKGADADQADATAPDKPKKSETAEKPPPPQEQKPPEKTWFRARLVDEDGEPMANEDYVLVDSAGAQRTGKLDAKGEVYIPKILPPGKSTISFPNIHLNPLKK